MNNNIVEDIILSDYILDHTEDILNGEILPWTNDDGMTHFIDDDN